MVKIREEYLENGGEFDIYGHSDCDKKHNHRLTVRKVKDKQGNDRFQLFKHFSETKKDEVQYDYPNLKNIVQRANEMKKNCYPDDQSMFSYGD